MRTSKKESEGWNSRQHPNFLREKQALVSESQKSSVNIILIGGTQIIIVLTLGKDLGYVNPDSVLDSLRSILVQAKVVALKVQDSFIHRFTIMFEGRTRISVAQKVIQTTFQSLESTNCGMVRLGTRPWRLLTSMVEL